MVAVCGYCHALSARTDRDPELIGKVADLVDTDSPLSVGAEGKYAGRRFTLTGRVQLKHPLGGLWNEWYIALEDGRWGWLAEAQGRFYLTFTQQTHAELPAFEQLHAGNPLNLGEDGDWVIAESSEASFHSAEGEIPWRVALNQRYRFADLGGRNGAFATLDYGVVGEVSAPVFYLGRETSIQELGIKARQGFATGPKLKTQAMNCPNCAGPLALRAPDQTQRVTCPSCGSLLGVEEGKFRFLKSLKQGTPDMKLELGSEGMLQGEKVICIGYMQRSCTVEGIDYVWGEYLLLTSKHGFRWLVESEGHWSLVDGVSAGEMTGIQASVRSFSMKGLNYRRFQDVGATVRGVWGEFYWKVELGEQAQITEFVSPPYSLSSEYQQHQGGGGELNWSLSTYLEPEDIRKAFQLKNPLPAPRGIASFQPNPYKARLKQVSLWMLAAMAVWFFLVMTACVRNRETLLWSQEIKPFERFPSLNKVPVDRPTTVGVEDGARDASSAGSAKTPKAIDSAGAKVQDAPSDPVFFTDPIEIKDGNKNLAVTISAPVDNAWIGAECALVNEETGLVESFEISSSWYHGVDDGESWSEGKPSETVYLSALPAGRYVLRVAPQWDGPVPPVSSFKMELRSGVMRWNYPGCAFLLIFVGPLLMLFRVMAFEGRRWQESMYTSSGGDSGGSNDSDDSSSWSDD
jgi:Domain of unknown function (DUF4178)